MADQKMITADQLRQLGVTIPESIPDCAWVPAGAVHFGVGEVTAKPDGMATGTIDIKIDAPFKWFQVDLKIPKQED